ncbi:hypothetical protein TgHK011_005528 [Trichoderma gracile]|nr:hypothetical protein TgHK011_005528 [Trichoderma gracile]
MFLLVFSRRHYQLACAPQAGAHERGFDLWQTIVMAGAAPQGPVAPSFWRPTTGRFDATHCLDAFSAPPSAAVPPPVPARGPGQLSATTRSTTDGQLRFYSLLREAACVMVRRPLANAFVRVCRDMIHAAVCALRGMVELGWPASPHSRPRVPLKNDVLFLLLSGRWALLLGRLCAHVPLKQHTHTQTAMGSCPGLSTTNSGRGTQMRSTSSSDRLSTSVRPASQGPPYICDAPPCDALRPPAEPRFLTESPYRACEALSVFSSSGVPPAGLAGSCFP